MFSWLGLKANPDSALRDSANAEPGFAARKRIALRSMPKKLRRSFLR